MNKIILLLFCITAFQVSASSPKYTLCVCAIFQNEAPYLKEWIEHHQKQGVEHFWLYNNNSTDHYMLVLEPFIRNNLVELIQWPFHGFTLEEWNPIQCRAYVDCIRRCKEKTQWCAFIDTDEFLFTPSKKNLPDALKNYKKHNAVVVNWVMYGTSNVEKILPEKKLVAELVYRSSFSQRKNLHVKSIVRPEQVENCVNPHWFFYKHSEYSAVNENFVPTPDHETKEHSVKVFRINHYWARDLDYFMHIKIPRQQLWFSDIDPEKTAEKLMHFEHQLNEVYDPILAK